MLIEIYELTAQFIAYVALTTAICLATARGVKRIIALKQENRALEDELARMGRK